MICEQSTGDLFSMYKRVISFILISIFLFSVTLGACRMPNISPVSGTLYVPLQYSTIQDAIKAANSGYTIQVANGTYHESIAVDKSLSLVGENPLNTIIDGNGTGKDVVRILANNVVIKGFTIRNGEGYDPASLSIGSRGNTISNNIMKQSKYGIKMLNSNDNYIANNVITNTWHAGIKFSSSNRSNVVGNFIEKNSIGVLIANTASENNTFYRNNFISNTNQASVFGPAKWDNGAEGNYWSDYHGHDLNGDGIGDTDTPHLGIDRYPLIEKWSETRDYHSKWTGVNYHTIVRCNSTVASFNFNYSLAQVSFNVTGPQNAVSFCNVTIDKALLDGNFTVLVDSASRSYVSTQNSTHTSLYFTFSHSVRKIQIRGTKVVGNTVPTVSFTFSPTSPIINETVTFDASSSHDPDGAIMNYTWNFGDGDISSKHNPIHKYIKNGIYTVTLTVTDNEGATNTITKTIVVKPFPPDYTLYYILVGIASGALIFGTALFLLKKKKKPASSTKITE